MARKNNNEMYVYIINDHTEQKLEVQINWKKSKRLENGKYRVIIQCITHQGLEKYIYAEFSIDEESILKI